MYRFFVIQGEVRSFVSKLFASGHPSRIEDFK